MGSSRWLLLLATMAAFASLGASGAIAHSGGPLTGTWSGYIAGSSVKRQHIVITVNANQTGGSWKLSNTCHGALTLDSISNGYHHFRRHLAPGSTCRARDIDCLRRSGGKVEDAITSHRGGKYDESGTLHRVRTA